MNTILRILLFVLGGIFLLAVVLLLLPLILLAVFLTLLFGGSNKLRFIRVGGFQRRPPAPAEDPVSPPDDIPASEDIIDVTAEEVKEPSRSLLDKS